MELCQEVSEVIWSNLPLYSGIVVVVICLVGLTSAVHATSESSYRLGLKFGHDEFQKCDTTCLNLDALGLDCQTNQHVDNVTSCNEGYAHIWLEKGQTEVATCILSGHTWDVSQES